MERESVLVEDPEAVDRVLVAERPVRSEFQSELLLIALQALPFQRGEVLLPTGTDARRSHPNARPIHRAHRALIVTPLGERRTVEAVFRHFGDEAAWRAYWEAAPKRAGWPLRRRPGAERLDQAGHFLAGVVLMDGFRLFSNGGLPLLERRHGEFVEEIVLRAAAYRPEEGTLPIRVDLHLSHQGLRDVRWPYWRPSSRIPISVASVDLGALAMPPGKIVWGIDEDSESLEEMARTVVRLALPWYGQFRHRLDIGDALLARAIPLLDHPISVELLLAECGPREARRYLTEHLAGEPRFWEEVERLGQPNPPESAHANDYERLATIAQLCRLL